jgi:hypothetical protein
LKAQGSRRPPSSLRNHDITSSQDQAINMTIGDKEIHLVESCSGTLVIDSKYSQLCRVADSIRSIGTVEGSTAGASGSLRSVDKAEVMRISIPKGYAYAVRAGPRNVVCARLPHLSSR